MLTNSQDDFSGRTAAEYFFRFALAMIIFMIDSSFRGAPLAYTRLGYAKNKAEALMVNE